MNWNIDPRTTQLIEQNRASGLKNAISSAEADVASSKVAQAELERIVAQQAAVDAKRGRFSDSLAMANLRDSLSAANLEKIQLKEELLKREALILDWIQSSEAFKKLAKKYSKKNNDEIVAEAREAALEVAEEDPEKFGHSNLTKRVKEKLGK
jgi:hypothetical protein